MPSTTVRLSAPAKRRLDQLQARVVLETGERVSLEALLEALVELGESEVHRLVAAKHPVDRARMDRLMDLSVRTGRGPFRSADIDRDLYGT